MAAFGEAGARVVDLCEISKVLARFDTIEQTLPLVLARLCESIPIRVATLMIAPGSGRERRPECIVWHVAQADDGEIAAVKARAFGAYAYVVGSPPDVVVERVARERLPASAAPSSGRGRFVSLPLLVDHDEILGALGIQAGGALDEPDLAFLAAVVDQLAIALDRVMAVEARQLAAEGARAGAELLATASASLFASLAYRATVSAVLRFGVRLADLCTLDEVQDDGRMERVARLGEEGSTEELVPPRGAQGDGGEGESPQERVLRCGLPMTFRLFRYHARASEGHDVDVRSHASRSASGAAIRACAAMAVPLSARGRTFGVLTFVRNCEVPYSAAEVAVASELGQLAALAIDNARLYERAQHESHARQDLLAIVSHDLRNPLNAILMSAQLFLMYPPADWLARQKRLDVIQRAARRMNRLIADLLDLAGIEAGHLSVEMAPQSIRALVREAVEASQNGIVQGVFGVEEGFDEDAQVECDRGRILQVLGNLVDNAVKFSPEGKLVIVRAVPSGDDVRFSVEDAGPGIPPEDAPHVFDRYWQAQRAARVGAGLGLSIAKGLVEAHGGRLWVEGEPGRGRGSTFAFTIPLVARRGAPSSR